MSGTVQSAVTAAGRGCVAALALALVLHGSTKHPPVRGSAASRATPAPSAVRTAPSVAAFGEFLREPYFRRRVSEFAVLDYGLFPEVRARPSFGRLVAALSNECCGCFATWTAVGTNDFTRKVFRIALAESGPTVYTPFLTNLLLAVERNPTAVGVSEVWYSLSAACTKLENYYMLNYAQPEVGELWMRAREFFRAAGRSGSVEWADEVLSGERWREYDECDFIDYGPSAVIRRPYKDGTW